MKSKRPSDPLNLIFQIVSLLIGLGIGLYQIYVMDKNSSIQALIIFGITVGVIILAFTVAWISSKYKEVRDELRYNRSKMEEVHKQLDQEKRLNNMEKEISVLKALMSKGKRGVIDPRIIIIVVLLILLYLYLKSIGLIN